MDSIGTKSGFFSVAVVVAGGRVCNAVGISGGLVVPGVIGLDLPGHVVEVGESVEAVRAEGGVDVVHVEVAIARPGCEVGTLVLGVRSTAMLMRG